MDLERGFGLLVDFYCEKWTLKKGYGYANGLLKTMDQWTLGIGFEWISGLWTFGFKMRIWVS